MKGLFKKLFLNPYGKISIIYLIFASIWIVLSDILAFNYLKDFYSIESIQYTKGLFFVFGSAILIYLVGKKFFRGEEKFRILTENLPGVVYICSNDKHFSMLYINDHIKDLAGYSEKEIIKSKPSLASLIHEDDIDEVHRKVDSAIQNKSHFHLIYRLQHKDGRWIWVEEYGTGVFRNNELIHLEGYIQDITDRKNIEAELESRKNDYEILINNQNDLIVKVNLSNEFEFVSPSYCKVFGKTQEELLGNTFMPLAHEDDRKNTEEEMKKLFEPPFICKLHQRAMTKDGWRWFEWVDSSILDASDNVKAIIGVGRDITEQKQAEEALIISENKFRTLFESMTEMVVLHELVYDENDKVCDYKIIDCNNAFSNITGISRDKCINKLGSEVYKQNPPPYLEEYSKVAKTGESYEFTFYYEPMDKHFMVSTVSPRKNSFATITNDITAIKEIEEIVRTKNKELESYLSITTHDLRSPLVNIHGFSKLFRENTDEIKSLLNDNHFGEEGKEKINSILENEIPETLDFIDTSINKIDNLLKGLTTISRTGRQEMTITHIDMNDLIDKVIKNHKYKLQEIGAITNIEDLPNCFGDENLLNQLFSNLVHNAIKFRKQDRELELNIGAYKYYNKILYFVKDNGIGIPSEDKEKIWEVFYQAHQKTKVLGEGIGLSLVKRIVDKHQGKIWLESEPDMGSTFKIQLSSMNIFK